MAEVRALKLFTKGDYIKSGQRDDKSPIKGVWFCSRDPFLYAQLWTWKKISTALREVRYTCRRPRTYDYHTYGARATHAKSLA